MTTDDLATLLRSIGLRATAGDLDDFIARATKGRWSPTVLLEEMARAERRDRERRSLERRIKMSRTGRFKMMADFDWNWPTAIDRDAIERALSSEIVRQQENLVMIASQGLGKTMITKNIAHQAVLAGHSALFVEASKLLLDLGSQESARALERRLRHYCGPELLCIDEVGYLSYDARAADLLFEIVTRRYENKSIVVTTNLTFSDWPTVFPNASCVTALIDRLTHHAEVTVIEGESYRRREAEEASKARRRARKRKKPTSKSKK